MSFIFSSNACDGAILDRLTIWNKTSHKIRDRIWLQMHLGVKRLKGCWCGLSHEGWIVTKGRFTPWTMNLDDGRWPFPMVWLHCPVSIVPFYKAFGLLTKCKLNVGPRGMTMHQKVNVLIFLKYMPQKGNFEQ